MPQDKEDLYTSDSVLKRLGKYLEDGLGLVGMVLFMVGVTLVGSLMILGLMYW